MHVIPRLKPELLAIVTKVATHLSVQRERAVSPCTDEGDTKCRYRGDNGTMCAVGVLIPDELYSPNAEESIGVLFGAYDGYSGKFAIPGGPAVKHLCSLAPSVTKGSLKEFLSILQRFHDNKGSYQRLLDGAPITTTNDEMRAMLLEGIDECLASHSESEWFA